MNEPSLEIERLAAGSGLATTIASLQFKFWGPLTGYNSLEEYERFLCGAAPSGPLPAVLVARRGPRFLGSVNLLISEMKIRPALSPWMAQLFVTDDARSQGVGNALVDAAVTHAADLGFRRIHLYTSGTLPSYYAMLGWKQIEEVEYLGKVRTVMAFELCADRVSGEQIVD
ncbi:GNAT family N-acetyltransferase [Bradyrhizobium australiense]|uniref:GNAT family N-acetyltransferase n=1 Tax=Bradyrhizobium australiense TaxID=2721161 RepID=A0A7Y4LZ41_9BRAD|nr:GNAT family N-acetyltransferase [Bradyrhizobium australiense]NOJ43410.1 GNAT family N-acetyltransferase [Bradyrhizobium australiense]